MEKSTYLRRLRSRYHIPLAELAAASGLSNQYISSAELGKFPPSQQLEMRLCSALERIIANRKEELMLLETACRICRGRLLEPVEDVSHE